MNKLAALESCARRRRPSRRRAARAALRAAAFGLPLGSGQPTTATLADGERDAA
jgi:hypothetical protein